MNENIIENRNFKDQYPVEESEVSAQTWTLLSSAQQEQDEWEDLNRRLLEECFPALVKNSRSTTTYGYDVGGRNTVIENANHEITTYQYYDDGSVWKITDANQHTTEYFYDACGRLVKTLFPNNTCIKVTYYDDGKKETETDHANRVTTYYYYPSGRLQKVKYGSSLLYMGDLKQDFVNRLKNRGTDERLVYIFGKLPASIQAKIDSSAAIDQEMLDAINRHIIKNRDFYNPDRFPVADACMSNETRNRIAKLENGTILQDEIEELNRLLLKEYYPQDMAKSIKNGIDMETFYVYDGMGNLISQTDANGHTTTFEYDSLGRRTQRKLPLGMTETYHYDYSGRLDYSIDFKNQTTRYIYNDRSGLLEKRISDGTETSYTYTPSGMVETVTDPSGTVTYRYDAMDRLVSQAGPNGTLNYTYDGFGNRTSVETPSGTVRYTYDVLNRLETVKFGTKTTTYAYDPAGNLERIEHANVMTTEYAYNEANQLTDVVHKTPLGEVIKSYHYTLGPTGLRTQVLEDTGRKVDYTYDDYYRLTCEKISDPASGIKTIAYTYDNVGNRLSKTADGVTTACSYDANDRLISDGESSYNYDDNGNTISKTSANETAVYIYDSRNRLTEASITTSQGTTTVRYTYDANGNRTGKAADGVETRYLVDSNCEYAQVLEERDASGALIASYVYGNDLICQIRGEDTKYYLYDGQGSTRALVNQTGAVTDTYNYDAFGLILDKTGSTPNDYLYTGEQYDPNIGFYYLRARYMNPAVGRFVTMDAYQGSLYDPVSLHKYLYCNSDPVNNIDPSGNENIASVSANLSIRAHLARISASASTYMLTLKDKIIQAFEEGGPAVSRMWNTIGYTAQRYAEQVFNLFNGLSCKNDYKVGQNLIDYLLKAGEKFALLEVKYKLPSRTGPAMTRLCNQVTSAVFSGTANEIVLWTLKEPAKNELKLLQNQLGSLYNSVTVISGINGLYQWIVHFFGF